MLMQHRGGNELKENNLNASLSQQIWIAPVSKASPSTELRDWLNWSCCSKYRPWCGWDLCRASWESVPNKIPVNDLNIPNQHFGKLTLQVWYNVFAIIGFFRLFLPSEMRQNWLSWTLEGSFFIEVQAINWNSLGLLAVESGGVLPKFKHPVAFLVWFWILFLTNRDAPVGLHSP